MTCPYCDQPATRADTCPGCGAPSTWRPTLALSAAPRRSWSIDRDALIEEARACDVDLRERWAFALDRVMRLSVPLSLAASLLAGAAVAAWLP